MRWDGHISKPRQLQVREYQIEHPDRVRANWKVMYALRTGKIVRPDRCSKCGSDRGKICGHHLDYSKPLDIVWLCYKCHRQTFNEHLLDNTKIYNHN